MSWLVLYARSRRLVIVFLVLTVGALLVYCLADARLTLRPLVVVMTLGVASASPGLVGPDPDLDRTAALSWAPRRAMHLLALTVLTAVVSLGLSHILAPVVPAELIIRDVLGLVGLLALGATLFGGMFGWCLPFTALVLVYLPGAERIPIAGWLIQPFANIPALLTSGVACVFGWLGYSVFGVGFSLEAKKVFDNENLGGRSGRLTK